MKTKEIDVLVSKSDINMNSVDIEVINHQRDYHPRNDQYKAKLIIEIPEKKIEITESEFDKAYSKCFIETNLGFMRLKEELGFE